MWAMKTWPQFLGHPVCETETDLWGIRRQAGRWGRDRVSDPCTLSTQETHQGSLWSAMTTTIMSSTPTSTSSLSSDYIKQTYINNNCKTGLATNRCRKTPPTTISLNVGIDNGETLRQNPPRRWVIQLCCVKPMHDMIRYSK